ncbi:MAG: DNA-3-methyladenine glycosylase [Muribaculaceae bacterium]|nr:DNA-3-methyladenine glycosylase [Muribaculaceae bacterium]
MIIPSDFYCGNPIDVARTLVGAYLCRRMSDGTIIRARIVELELYHESERGCHAYGGKCTPRNDAMFLDGGHAYVYLCYGLHNMLNIVLGKTGTGVAVLIRGLEYDGCNGPGKLTRVLNITRDDNKLDLATSDKMWLEPRDTVPEIAIGTRIGIDYAGLDAKLPWRFAIANNPYVSRPI